EVAEVLVDRCERVVVELARDLLEARRIAVLVHVDGEVIENLALALRQRHGTPRGMRVAFVPAVGGSRIPAEVYVIRRRAEVQAIVAWRAPAGVLGELVTEARSRGVALEPRGSELDRAAAAAPPPPSLAAALRRPDVAVIAEIKRRSPSKGDL